MRTFVLVLGLAAVGWLGWSQLLQPPAGFPHKELPRESCGDARMLVESALSMNIVVLDEWKNGVGAHRRDDVDKLFRAVGRFRQRQPFGTGDPGADEVVDAILTSVSQASDSTSPH